LLVIVFYIFFFLLHYSMLTSLLSGRKSCR